MIWFSGKINKVKTGLTIFDQLRNGINKRRKAWKQTEGVFGKIYRRNDWGSNQSISGTGSEEIQTKELVRRLPGVLRTLEVTSVLDIPCGDFNWMQHIDLAGINYAGADIVGPLITKNEREYAAEGIRFYQLNLIIDTLPRADFVLCRDCLVHLSNADVTAAVKNVAKSGSVYLAATTFPGRGVNRDIKTGGWRPLDLQAHPFCFPEPLAVINERCTEAGGIYADKSLAVWRVIDLPQTRRDDSFVKQV